MFQSLSKIFYIIDYACIGRFSSDGQYYRALVTAVNREEGTADLVYVDYGTKETVPIERYSMLLINIFLTLSLLCRLLQKRQEPILKSLYI